MARLASRLAVRMTVLSLAAGCVAVGAQDGQDAATGWPSTNYVGSANRYSPLTQITAENVATLERVWSFHLKPADYTGRLREDQAIPLVIGTTMYLGSPYGAVIALDATTGVEKWRFQFSENAVPSKRGIAYWPGDGQVPRAVPRSARHSAEGRAGVPRQPSAVAASNSVRGSGPRCTLRTLLEARFLNLDSFTHR